MRFWTLLLATSVTFATTFAADDTAALTLDDSGERNMLRLRASRRCARRLESCVANAGNDGLPIQNWLGDLRPLSGDDDNVDELLSILNAVQVASAGPFVSGLSGIGLRDRVRALRFFRSTIADLNDLTVSGDNFDVAQSLDGIATILGGLFSFLNGLIDAAQFLFLSLALRLTLVTLQLTDAAQDLAVASFVVVPALLTRFLVSTLRDATAILLFPFADSDCLVASMDCNYGALMNGVVPVVLEVTVTVEGEGENDAH
ncbi:hypothetical protein FisN_28Lh049 [Fistulifera solaris]|jgi:hypothetical protein|uniref:Uncharacterized protein n=1 Tax=Fistulifera solaris TaxID=1519565 RepID=A0A1Z5KT02_FISSO|nr:hypothetical protein FisN_28Lh049 [Fistulifera solaris]|eukprot:GAX29222.1 hypothetical protein FisN_28Lh049 [Fistulifera solaris]